MKLLAYKKLNFSLLRLVILLAVIFCGGQYVFAGSSGNTTGDVWAEKFGYIAMDGGGSASKTDGTAGADGCVIIRGYTATIYGTSSRAFVIVCEVGGSCVDASVATLATTTWALARSSGFTLADNTEYELRLRNNFNDMPLWFANARLILKQTGAIDKLELVHEYINASSTESAGSWTAANFFNYNDADSYGRGASSTYFEATLRNNTSGYGARLAPGPLGTINSGSAAFTRERSGVISLNDNTDYDTQFQYADIGVSRLIIQLSDLFIPINYVIEGGVRIEGSAAFE